MVKTRYFEEILEIPEGVTVKLEGNNRISVKGPQGGPIIKDFSHASGIQIELQKNELKFISYFPKTKTLALVKTLLNIIKNLIIGVQTNYKYLCKVCYIHFPCTVEIKNKNKEIHVVNFLGERAPRKTSIPDTVKVEVQGDDVILTGPDKEDLGRTAANLKKVCHIRKKDPRVFQDGVYLYKVQHGNKIIWQIK
jgi:large subunit ribosomal protein L6